MTEARLKQILKKLCYHLALQLVLCAVLTFKIITGNEQYWEKMLIILYTVALNISVYLRATLNGNQNEQ